MDYQKVAEEFMAINKTVKQNMSLRKMDEIKVGEMAFLLALLEENNGIIATNLANKLNVVPSRITAIINSLIKKQYVVRLTDKNDRRKTLICITQSGYAFCLTKKQQVLDELVKLFEKLGERDTLEYLRIYKKLSQFTNECN